MRRALSTCCHRCSTRSHVSLPSRTHPRPILPIIMAAARRYRGSDYYVDPTLNFRRGSAASSSSRTNPFEGAYVSVFVEEPEATAGAATGSAVDDDPDADLRIDTRAFLLQQQAAEASSSSRRGSAIYDERGERRDSWREDVKKSPVQRRPSWRDGSPFLNRPSPDQMLPQDSRDGSHGTPRASWRAGSPGMPLPHVPSNRTIPTAESMSIRQSPRSSYLEAAEKPSKRISKMKEPEKKLLLLDLNGTLLYRVKKTREASGKPIPRPFLKAFLEYCLGSSSQPEVEGTEDSSTSSTATNTHGGALGTHFHSLQLSPGPDEASEQAAEAEPHSRSQGAYELIVWSSAQPANVDSMLLATLNPQQRARLLRVWARDTLVPQRFYFHKVQTTKDLEVVWHALNLQSEERLRADERDAQDASEPDDSAEEGELGAASKAALLAEETGPWNATNTLLLDDTPDKARLQPFNHLLVTEFGAEQVEEIKALRKKVRGKKEESRSARAMIEPLRPIAEAKKHQDADEEAIAKKQQDVIEKHDNLLLQTIGVLEHLRWQDNVANHIKSGGLLGFGAAALGVDEHKTDEVEKTSAEYWIQEGLKALSKAGIETNLDEQMPP